MFDILFKNATVITMCDENKVLYNAFCAVEGKKIVYISEKEPENACSKRVIDCRGDILMPGLINCHAHTAMTLLRGFSDDSTLNDWLFNHIFPAESKLDLKAVSAGFTLGAAEMLSTGTTTFCDMYFYSDETAKLADSFGMRACISNGVIALSNDYEFEEDRSVKELRTMLKDKSLSDRITPMASIHCERTSPPDVWEKAVKLAKENNLMMHIHLSETESDHMGCVNEYGITPAQRLEKYGVFDQKTTAAHCVHITEGDMELLARHGVSAVHNPVSNLKLASGIADICALREHGVNVALGTDGCSSNNTLDMFEDMKLAALLAKNKSRRPECFTAYDALKLATVNGAKAIGKENIIGKIKTGYEADLILIDTHNVRRTPMYDALSTAVYCLSGQDVYLTMVQGKVLYERGEFKTLDAENAIKTVNEYAVPMVRSVVK